MKRMFSRRTLLRGSGVALALPWMESLAPRGLRAQTLTAPKRVMFIFFPNGTTPQYWEPTATGQGQNWQLTPILEPFAPLKEKMTVLTNLENYSAYEAENDTFESHGLRPGCMLTCANVRALQEENDGEDVNGISFDQVIATHANYRNSTPLPSLQVGLGTSNNFCDGPPCSYSRVMSWSETAPMDPEVDPGAAFDRIAGAAGTPGQDPGVDAERRRNLNQSILDAVLENTATVQARLGASDRAKLDLFLTSVRTVEERAIQLGTSMGAGMLCSETERPTLQAQFQLANGQNGYDKGDHADVMNDLIAMALTCDITRVVTHMMEFERSEFVGDHIQRRDFSENGSTEGNGPCGNYHNSQHGDQNEFATIAYWQAQKVSELCQRLDAIDDGPGVSVLDNSVVLFGSCMDGGRHNGDRLPMVMLGGGGGVFRTNQHIAFGSYPDDRPLRDLYFTIMNAYFGLGVTDFGNSEKAIPISMITEMLA